MSTRYIAVHVTCPSYAKARNIADRLLKARLIACANITGAVRSYFWWDGKIDKAREYLLVMKTVRKNYARLEKEVKANHPYEVPEIIAFPIESGSREYLQWISASVK